ncbi:MAG: CDP-glycerol glycerophosphotransferase family protein [Promethearchaeota archaeon]
MQSNIKIFKLINLVGLNSTFISDLIIYHLSKLFRGKIDEKLIILGSSNGKYFSGNTKYLYKYLKENTDYKLIWMSKNRKLNRKLEEEGINTIYAYSIKAIKLLRKAKAVFVTHGYNDVLPIKYSPGTLHIQTWHGGDIKVIGIDPYSAKFIYSKWSRIFRLKIRDHEYVDYIVALSGAQKPLKILADAFRYPLKKIIPTGYPRNDLFFSKETNLREKFRKKYNVPDTVDRIILYAPTFRRNYTAKFPLSNEDLITLNRLMGDTNSTFLLKAHISERIIAFKEYGNIRIMDVESDTQELLYITDILITDYSSIYHDFLLLDRPMILFPYDYNEYIKEWGIYYNSLEEIAPGPVVYTATELIETIKKIKEIDKDYKVKRIELRDYFNAHLDGNSAKRLLKFLKLI